MKPFEIAALVACLMNLALAVFVLGQNSRSRLHLAYFVWGLGVALWNLGAFFLYRVTTPDAALPWAKVLQFGIILAPLGLYETSRVISGRRERPRIMVAFIALHALFALSLFTPWFVAGVFKIREIGYWSTPGQLFYAYIASYTYLTVSPLFFLDRAARQSTSLQKTRLRALLIALVLIWIAGTNDILPILLGEHSSFIQQHFFPLGNIAACIYMTIVAYSVLQHMLLDVHVALGRFTAHIVRFGFLTLCSLCLLLLLKAVFSELNGVAFACALFVQIACAVLASTLFPRIFGAGADTFERRILGDRLEYGDQVRNFTQAMTWFTDFATLFAELHLLMTKTFRLESYTVLLRDVRGAFQLYRTHPAELANDVPEVRLDSPIVKYFEDYQGAYLSHAGLRLGAVATERARERLGDFGATLCFALRSQEELVGFVMVGNKVNGEPFTASDITLFTGLVKGMGVVVNQIRMKMEVLQAQEFELLGRMSSGMAHDLNNLLTPVSTLLQLGHESGTIDDELLPVAANNVAAIRAYIREGLFFSEHHRLDFHPGRVDHVVARAIEVAGASRAVPVTLVNEVEREIWAEMDHIMVQRLLANLITNAIDASPEGGRVTVTLDQLPRSEEAREWLRIKVIDEGQGIASADLERVFTPYFTTKNTGDRHRGFGLGLAICRKIAALHGGELSIDSELHRGTTVIFDLPSKQIFPAAAAPPVNFRAA
jgi:signal transduction histidine kinase